MKRNSLVESLIKNGLNEMRREEVERKNASSLKDFKAAAAWHALLIKAREYFILELQDAIDIPDEVKVDYYEPVMDKAYFVFKVDGCAPIRLKFEVTQTGAFKDPVFISPSIEFDDDDGKYVWCYGKFGTMRTTRLDLALADAQKKDEQMQQVVQRSEERKKQPNDLEYENVEEESKVIRKEDLGFAFAELLQRLARL